MINAENAAYRSSKFAAMNKRTKLLQLAELVKTYTASPEVPPSPTTAANSGFMEETGKLFRSKSARFARSVLRIAKSGGPASPGSLSSASSISSLNSIGATNSVSSSSNTSLTPTKTAKHQVRHDYLVKLKDPKQDVFINATFSISIEKLVLANAVTTEILFSWPTVSTSGWVSIPLGIKVFHGKGGIHTLQTTDADVIVKQLEVCLAKAMSAAKDNPDSVSWYAKKKKKKSDKSKEERDAEKQEKKKAKKEAKERKELEKAKKEAAKAAALLAQSTGATSSSASPSTTSSPAPTGSAQTMRKSSSGTAAGVKNFKLLSNSSEDYSNINSSGTSTPTSTTGSLPPHHADASPLSSAVSFDNLSDSGLSSHGGSSLSLNKSSNNNNNKSLRSLLKVGKEDRKEKEERKEKEREEKERKEKEKREDREAAAAAAIVSSVSSNAAAGSDASHGFTNPFARMGSRIAARRSSKSHIVATETPSPSLTFIGPGFGSGSGSGSGNNSNNSSILYDGPKSPKSPRSPSSISSPMMYDDELSALRIKNQWLNDRLEKTTHENAYLVAEKDYLQSQVKQLEDSKSDLERHLEAAKKLLAAHGISFSVPTVESSLESSYGGSSSSISSLKTTTFAAAATSAGSLSGSSNSMSTKPEFNSIQAKFDAMYDEFLKSNGGKK